MMRLNPLIVRPKLWLCYNKIYIRYISNTTFLLLFMTYMSHTFKLLLWNIKFYEKFIFASIKPLYNCKTIIWWCSTINRGGFFSLCSSFNCTWSYSLLKNLPIARRISCRYMTATGPRHGPYRRGFVDMDRKEHTSWDEETFFWWRSILTPPTAVWDSELRIGPGQRVCIGVPSRISSRYLQHNYFVN